MDRLRQQPMLDCTGLLLCWNSNKVRNCLDSRHPKSGAWVNLEGEAENLC